MRAVAIPGPSDKSLAANARAAIVEIARAAAVAIVGVVAMALLANGALNGREIIAMLIGGAVGAVEILGRYRHAPVRAVLNWSGVAYVFINMGASWAAYYMLGAFEVFKTLVLAKDLTQILTAGVGSLVFMRSSLFKVRVGDSDIGIGPAAILDTLLLIADRGVDRREAVARAQDVSALVAHVKDPALVATILTKYSLALMQNVDAKTSQDVVDAINKIMADTAIPDTVKMDIVALRLGVIVGPDVLEAAVAALGDRLSAAAPAAPAVAQAPAPAISPSVADLKAEIERSK